jgi:transposase InsO family protein
LQLSRRAKAKRRCGEPQPVKQRATHPHHVWSYDFLEVRTERGQKVRILAVLDEFTRECLALLAARSFPASEVLRVLEWLLLTRGIPEHLRSDNGPEFIAQAVQAWLAERHCQTLFITPGSPWENPFIESFNGSLREECLNRMVFGSLREVQLTLDTWKEEYNHYRPHSSLGYLSPATFAQQASYQPAAALPSLSLDLVHI